MRGWVLISGLLVAGPVWADHEFADANIEEGQSLYIQHCATCHGASLEGQPDWRRVGTDGVLPAPPHDAAGHTWHHETDLLMEYTKLGGAAALAARGVEGFKSGMPAFEGVISDGQILDVIAYIRSTWPEHAQQVQAQRTHSQTGQ